MIVRHGIDMVEVDRIQNSIEKGGKSFLKRVFTSGEQAYCEPKRMKYEHYAARFAAKEAVTKVLKSKKYLQIAYSDIEICRKATGKPFVKISQRALAKLKLPSRYQLEISLSHERKLAIAACVLVIP